MQLDRGLSDTNVGEANQDYYIRSKHRNWRFVAHPITHLIEIKYCSEMGLLIAQKFIPRLR
jgi:hypothetical protein